MEHIVDSPLCRYLNLVIEWSHDPLNPEGPILECIQFWQGPVGGDVS